MALRDTLVVQKLPLTEKHEKVVEALLKYGADPNLYALDFPALHLAVFLRNPKIVKLLIKYGANVNFKYNNDVTPLLLVVDPLKTEKNFEQYINIYSETEFKFRNKENFKLDREITQALLDAGANINEKTLGGNTLLVNAVIGENLKFTEFLIGRGANLEEAIEIIHKHQDLLKNKKIPESLFSKYLINAEKTFQLNKNNIALEFLEGIKTLRQKLRQELQTRFNETKSPENNKNNKNNKKNNKNISCKEAFVKLLDAK